MWAIFEQPGDGDPGSDSGSGRGYPGSAALAGPELLELSEQTPELIEAFRIHGLAWG
jgi:hypothetical protein